MQPFREATFYLLVWRAYLAGLIAVVLMISRNFELGVTCLIGANVALLFSLGLVAWNSYLDDERVTRTEAWRRSSLVHRPVGPAERCWARRTLGELVLRFAKDSALVAIAFCALALVIAAG